MTLVLIIPLPVSLCKVTHPYLVISIHLRSFVHLVDTAVYYNLLYSTIQNLLYAIHWSVVQEF